MSALAETIGDPEYAIGIDHIILAKASRVDDPADYDYVIDRLAFLLVDRGRFGEAIAILRRQAELSPTDAGVWENLGEAQCKAGNFKDAVASFRKSLDLDNSQETAHEALADALFGLGDVQGSETELAATIAIYDAQYHGNETSDSFHQMMKGIVNVSKSDPALAKIHLKYAKVLLADKKTPEALAEVDAASKADSDLRYQYLRAEIYDATQQPAKAAAARDDARLKVAELVKKVPRGDFLAMFSFPEELFMIEDDKNDGFDRAHELILLLEPSLATGKLKPGDRLFLGLAYCVKDRVKECREQADAAFKADPKLNTSKLHTSVAKALAKENDIAGATEHFQRAYELEPLNVTYRTDYEASRQQ